MATCGLAGDGLVEPGDEVRQRAVEVAAEASIGGMLAVLASLSADLAAAATLLVRFATLWFGMALGLGVWAASPDLLGLASAPSPTPDAAG